ncbi:MAG: 3-deoxy-manno-octulosonate cytidylyltransferase [Acidobacteria bacterium]|nr:3-deoxy-manno-octulosonate cytidylyltransferase [Acidobacteriota bacterium]
MPPGKIVAVIPARYASTRFPGKPLADLAGRPLIEHVYRRVTECRAIGTVIIATDDERIRKAVEAFGGRVQMTNRAHVSGTDRVAEVARAIDCELVVNVQGDEPLIEPSMIEEALAPFADPALQMGTLRRRIEDRADFLDPHVTKVVVNGDGRALYFSRTPIPHHRDSGAPLEAWKHVGLYVYRRRFLLEFARMLPTPLEGLEALEQLRAIEHGVAIAVVETRHNSIGVDTPDDLEKVRRALGAAART